MATRAVIHLPARIAPGEIVEVRAIAEHVMETGFRADATGRVLPRDIVRRMEVRLDDRLVFAADLHPSVAANPYVAFMLKAERSGALVITWRGDHGYEHTERRALVVG